MDIKTYLTKQPDINEIIITLPVTGKWNTFILVFDDGRIDMDNLSHSVKWKNDVPDPIGLCLYVDSFNKEQSDRKLLIDEKALEAIIGRWVLLNDTINIDLLHSVVDYDNIAE